MKIDLIQSNCSSINSIYIYRNFLDDADYLEKILSKLKKHTEKDYQGRSTSVKSTMTTWGALLKDNDFNFVHMKALETVWNTICLRSPKPHLKYKLNFKDAWGMRHTAGDFTQDHIHDYDLWSGVFYLDVPCETRMWFEDFQQDVLLENNMFIFFQGATKHRVSAHYGEKDRFSIAHNIKIESV
jgi:hypothetical protein